MISVSGALNLMNVGHCIADFRSFEELKDELCAAQDAGAWVVYLIHGVGAESKELYIERDVHERLLDYLAAEQDIWTQPFITVASWIRRWQEGQRAS
jgi:endo-alpha-1,4-polygalactosaminidase (GH114 family)